MVDNITFKGKRIGIPEWAMTAIVWLKGIFQSEYGVRPEDVEYRVGGLENPGRQERIDIALPTNVKLSEIPEDRTAVLGLVTTKTGILENADDLKNRIAEAERYIPRERLALSTQCGFASVIEGNMLTVEEEESKLRLIAETAKEVWG